MFTHCNLLHYHTNYCNYELTQLQASDKYQ